MGSTFSWLNAAGGAWGTAANWYDITTSQSGVAVPGSLDVAIIDNAGTITGTGTAASVTFLGYNVLAGTVNAGFVQNLGSLSITPGGTLHASSANINNGQVSLAGTTAAFLVDGSLAISAFSSLVNGAGGFVQSGNVFLGGQIGGAIILNFPVMSPTGVQTAIEIGNAGSAQANALTIDPGYTLSGSGHVAGFIGSSGQVVGSVINNGTVIASGNVPLTIGAGNTIGTASATFISVTVAPHDTLTGTGIVDIQPGATITLDAVATANFQLDGTALLDVAGGINSGSTISLLGNVNTVALDDSLHYTFGSGLGLNPVPPGFNSGSLAPFAGTITGFNSADAIGLYDTHVSGLIATGVVYSGGTLSLNNGTAVLASLLLSGVPSSAQFEITGTSNQQRISLAQTLSWIGSSGSWTDAANWFDITTGQSGVASPGSLDVVTINNGTVTDGGTVASLTLLGTDQVKGTLNAGTVIVGGGTVATQLQVDGQITAATASMGGGILSLGSAGIFDVGHAGTDQPNAVNIATGATYIATGAVATNIVDNGLIQTGGTLTLGVASLVVGPVGSAGTSYALSSLSGSGKIDAVSGGTVILQASLAQAGLTFQLDGSATLAIEASIATGNTIALAGSSNEIVIDDQWFQIHHPAPSVGGSSFYTSSEPNVGAIINGFDTSDRLVFVDDAQVGTTLTSLGYNGNVLSLLNGNSIVSTLIIARAFNDETFILGMPTASSMFPGQTEQVITMIPCFAAGTRIGTPRGQMAVERLRVGDPVLTVSGKRQRIQWIGRRTVDCRRHKQPERVLPIRIAPHAFGQNRPSRALYLSPDHSVFVDDGLLPIKHLVNDYTIAQCNVDTVTYYHIELASHDIVLAEGLPTESYLETGGRAAFENNIGSVQLHPDFTPDEAYVGMVWRNLSYAPLITDPVRLDRVRRQLALQAAMLAEHAIRPRQRRRAG